MTRGLFISFDGIDGTGKTTQAARFAEWVAESGREVVHCRDPGGTPLGERLRSLILHQSDVDIGHRAETLLYMAARAQLVEEIIRPALQRGACVISDRFLLANVAYQSYGWGLVPDDVWHVGSFATGRLFPDGVFVLDLSLDIARTRCGDRTDRLESRSDEYFQRVRDGFLVEAKRDPERICVVDARGSIDEVQQLIQAEALRRWPGLRGDG